MTVATNRDGSQCSWGWQGDDIFASVLRSHGPGLGWASCYLGPWLTGSFPRRYRWATCASPWVMCSTMARAPWLFLWQPKTSFSFSSLSFLVFNCHSITLLSGVVESLVQMMGIAYSNKRMHHGLPGVLHLSLLLVVMRGVRLPVGTVVFRL